MYPAGKVGLADQNWLKTDEIKELLYPEQLHLPPQSQKVVSTY
jgi:hypothetical protein